MDRRLIAVGILAVIVAIVLISGCTSGPATNATVKPSPAAVVNKTVNNTTAMGVAVNNTTYTGVQSVPAPVNNTTKTTDVRSTPVKP